MKIYVYYAGKPRDAAANAMAGEYMKRSSRYMKVEMREIQPGRFDPWEKHPSANKILLDPAGKMYDSAQFAKLVGRAEEQARDLVFLVAGASGPPEEWRKRELLALSLSPLTFPHELARVLLAEQIYRALTMLRGHPYAK